MASTTPTTSFSDQGTAGEAKNPTYVPFSMLWVVNRRWKSSSRAAAAASSKPTARRFTSGHAQLIQIATAAAPAKASAVGASMRPPSRTMARASSTGSAHTSSASARLAPRTAAVSVTPGG